MLAVTFVCSDSECAEERQAVVDSLEELDGLCDCGFGLVVLDLAEVEVV
jgi:hypothetical protein